MSETQRIGEPLFPKTRWSVVLAAKRDASPESAAALETICRTYWYPLYAYVRRCGYSPHDAQDLTQGFFFRLLEKQWLNTADPGKGKLRSFLVVAMKRFMAAEWRRGGTIKRGGNQVTVTFDTTFAESRYAADHRDDLRPEDLFDQQWALTLLDLALQRLQAELSSSGRPEDFEALKTCLMAERGAIDYPAIAVRLKTSEGAARVTVHRFRRRFREIYREELLQTLNDTQDLEEELRHLARALAGK